MDITVTLTQDQIDFIEQVLPVDENNVTKPIEDFVQEVAIQALSQHALGVANPYQAMTDAYNNAVAPVNAAFGTSYTWA